MKNVKVFPISLCITLFLFSFLSLFIYSCSDSYDQAALESISETELESRSVSCEPEGDCDDPFTQSFSFAGGGLSCQYTVTMTVSICDGNYNFEELSVTPAFGCTPTQDELDEAYRRFIRHYMRGHAEVAPCSASITTHSNYIKKNCVQACYGFANEGEPSPIVYVPCSGGATGCCIETTTWCEFQGNHIEIVHFTESVAGTCTGDLSSSCFIPWLKNICRADRCGE